MAMKNDYKSGAENNVWGKFEQRGRNEARPFVGGSRSRSRGEMSEFSA